MRRLLVVAALSAALAACATTPTVFAPAAGPQAVGFSELKIEPGRYRVTFRGGRGAPMAQVSDYALLRAADLTIADGYDWFRVVDRIVMESAGAGGPQVSFGAAGGSGGHRSNVGLGVGTTFNLDGGPALSQTLEILMGRGAKPADGEVYDARQVRQTIGARA
jgi:hypothetical protein